MGRKVPMGWKRPLVALAVLTAGFASAGPARAAPPTPTGLVLHAASGTHVALAWNRIEQAPYAVLDRYAIYRDGVRVATSDPQTSSFVDSGLVAGRTYVYRVVAEQAGGNSAPSAAVTATTPATETVLTTCPAAPLPSGHYRIYGQILGAADRPCLTLQDVTNTTVDCSREGVRPQLITLSTTQPTIRVTRADHFFIYGCEAVGRPGLPAAFAIAASSAGTFANGKVSGTAATGISLTGSTGLVVDGNDLVTGSIELADTSTSAVTHNTITGPAKGMGTIDHLIGAQAGTGNTIGRNTLDGYARRGYATPATWGSRAGIVLGRQSRALVADNAITAVFDTAVEANDFVDHSVLATNTVTYAANAALAQVHRTAFEANQVAGNLAGGTPRLMAFVASSDRGLPTGRTALSFTGNSFWGNRMTTSPAPRNDAGVLTNVATELRFGPTDPANPAGYPLSAGGNTFLGNDFGAGGLTPVVTPASLVSGALNNTCHPTQPALGC